MLERLRTVTRFCMFTAPVGDGLAGETAALVGWTIELKAENACGYNQSLIKNVNILSGLVKSTVLKGEEVVDKCSTLRTHNDVAYNIRRSGRRHLANGPPRIAHPS